MTASNDETARVWSTDTGALLGVLDGHQAGVIGARFLADGASVFTWSYDGTARVWPVWKSVPALIAHAKNVVARCLTDAERAALHLPVQSPGWCRETGKWPHPDEAPQGD
ncbi:MAG: hypothetical protein KDJ68_13040 [Rhodobiaceae bacterium]|nr:hypothetical protein [Rhodobiaceae bacterium]